MNKNKKVMMIGAGLALGSALVVTSAFADIGGAKGYEAYKDAIKATATIDSATHRINLSLRDNGNELLNVKSEMKHSGAAEGASGQVTITGDAVARTLQFYSQDGQQVVKSDSSDTYYLLDDSDGNKWKHEGKFDSGDHEVSPEFSQEMENVLDALVGNLKNYVSLSDSANGGKSIDATLTGSQIPSVVNVIGSLFVKEALSGKHHGEEEWSPEQDIESAFGLDFKQIASHFPQLTDSVNIDEIALRADIDENDYIRNQEIDFTISGKDASGQTHNVVLSADIEMSAVNATTPDTIDLTGKTTESLSELHDKN